MTRINDLKITAEWLQDEKLQALFDILEKDAGEARVAGGAVRNTLMGKAASDVDICTTVLPHEVVERLEIAGHKAVPTGIEHGTVTAVISGKAFEITTLRKDIKTDGRHAEVEFGMDWETDANRRDLTINGLYCDREGHVYDYVNGYRDIKSGQVRFIGDAQTRIREDSLRILRFFRFFAWYGSGRPDADGLKACARGKDLLKGLSVERVWMELKKMLAASDPSRAILWMRTTGILASVLPETEKWGTDSVPALMRLEQQEAWSPDALFRLMSMVRPHVETMENLSTRLNFSKSETLRMTGWAASDCPKPDTSSDELERLLYRGDRQGIIDRMRLEVVHLQGREDAAGAHAMLALAKHAENWKRPKFPLKGQDLVNLGHEPGPEMGSRLKALEEAWIESGFSLGKQELIKRLSD